MPASQAAQAVRLLKRRDDFRRLFLAAVVSYLGDWFALVAVAGLVQELTGSDGATAIVFAAQMLPVFVFAPLAGVMADRFDRRRLLIAADLARVPPALLLVVAAVLGQAWLAYLGVILISVFAAVAQPIPAAVTPNLVEEDEIGLATTVMASVWGTMLFLGAAIGGLATAALGRETSFVLNAVTFAVSALILLRVRTPLNTGEVSTAGAGVLAHFGEVWQFVRPRKLTRALMVTKLGVGFGNGVVGLLPIYALDRFGVGDAGVGWLLAARGLGVLLGPYMGRRLVGGDGRRLLRVAGLSVVSYGLVYALLPMAGGIVMASALVFAAHLGGGNQWVASTEGLQRTTPDAMRGRVMGLDFALVTLSIGVSSLIAGGLAEWLGLAGATYVMALSSAVYGALWLIWTRDLWAGDSDPIAAAVAPRPDPVAPVAPH